MLETHHHWLPVIMAIYLPLSFIITYSMAVAYKHVEPGFPYISDTGTIPPDSCVFGQLLNIGAVIGGFIIYIRYSHILYHFRSVPGRMGLLRLNTAAYIIGLLTVLGVSIVGNFQETNVIGVHLLGAFMGFVVGFVYFVLQTVISYKVRDTDIPGNTPNIRKFRVLLNVIDFIFLVLAATLSPISKTLGPGPGVNRLKWTAHHPGYPEHLVATISEWLVAFTSVTYFATFYTEFKHFRVKAPEIVYYDVSDNACTAETTGEERRGFAQSSGPNYRTIQDLNCYGNESRPEVETALV
ncbi:DNA damage-regulated autophagy modulator protein 2-like isoform X3 [Dreissena polymorpha]|uniref:CWH43-like N-terminal domain-containing protein n=1 Tax=Dreissena polymorpha TaxID=45954 RepID=A0A9D4CMX1_DREPO|nr:DNA damage-regulated autophagy modulator protein 2-like isoform X3 [Dreissena polymorpha]KAH3727651.1 hypothetical protein DPMN_053590 [Dreissena polymorpha]